MSIFASQEEERSFAKEWSCSPLSSMEPSQEPQTNAMESEENEVERHLDFTTHNCDAMVAGTAHSQNLDNFSGCDGNTNASKCNWMENSKYKNKPDNVQERLLRLLEFLLSKPRVSGGYANYITFTEFMELIAAMQWREVEGEECWYDVVRGEPCHRTSNMTRLCYYVNDYSATRHTQEIDFRHLGKFFSDKLHNVQNKTKISGDSSANIKCKNDSTNENVDTREIPLCLHETNVLQTQNQGHVALCKNNVDQSMQNTIKIKPHNDKIFVEPMKKTRSTSPLYEEVQMSNKENTRDKVNERCINDNEFCRYRIPTRSSLYRESNHRTNVNVKKINIDSTKNKRSNSNTRNNKESKEELAGESVFERLYAHEEKKLHSEDKELKAEKKEQQLTEHKSTEKNKERVNVIEKSNSTSNSMPISSAAKNITFNNVNHKEETASFSEPKSQSSTLCTLQNKDKCQISRGNIHNNKNNTLHNRYNAINRIKSNSYLEIQQKEQQQRQRELELSLSKQSPHTTSKWEKIQESNSTGNSVIASLHSMHYNVPTASSTARLSCAEEVHYDPILHTPSTPRERYHAPPPLPRFVPPRYVETVARLRRAASLGIIKKFEEQLREDADERKMHENERRQLLENTAILKMPVVKDDTNHKTLSVNIRLSSTFNGNSKERERTEKIEHFF